MSFFHSLLTTGGLLQIVSVESTTPITVPYDHLLAEVQVILPSVREVTLSNGASMNLSVIWTSGTYNGESPNVYSFTGTLTLIGGIENPGGITASANITVSASLLVGGKRYYKASALTQSSGQTITTLADQLGIGNASGINTPVFGLPQCNIIPAGGNNVKSLLDQSDTAINTNATGVSLLASDYMEIFFSLSSQDTRQTSGIQIIGSRTSDTNITGQIFINSAGDFTFAWGFGSGNRITYTVSAMLADGESFVTFVSIKVKANPTGFIEVRKNGMLQTGSFVTGTIANYVPGSYNNTAQVYLLNINANGAISTNTTPSRVYHLSVQDDVKTAAQSLEIEKEFVRNMCRGWSNRFHVTPLNYLTKRQEIVDFYWLGTSGIPSTTNFDDRTLGFTGNMNGVLTSSLTGIGSVTRLRYRVTDRLGNIWENNYWVVPPASSPNTEFFIVHRGHDSEEPSTTQNMMQTLVNLSYTVVLMTMPRSTPYPNGQNTINGGAGPYSAAHEALYADGLITDTYSAGHLFFEGQYRCLSHLLANQGTYGTISRILACGLSGGCYTVIRWAAFDTRIEEVYGFRGERDQITKWFPFIPSATANDQEQPPANGQTNNGPQWGTFHENYSSYDNILLAAQGRKCMYISHVEDSALLGGYTYFPPEQALQTRAQELGGEYLLFMNFTPGQTEHRYQTPEINAMLAQL